jgi:hypothetical protein
MIGFSESKRTVGNALGVAVPEVEGGVGGSEHSRCVGSVDDAPVTGNQTVVGVPEEELRFGDSLGVRLTEVDEPGR